MTALWWWITGLSATGIIGLIALFFAANAMFWIVVQAALKGFMWFFRTRIGFGVVVGVAVWYGTSWYQHSIDVAACEAEKIAFKAAQVQRDKDIDTDAKQFVLKQIADEYMAQQDSDYEVAQFKAALDPAGKCTIGADAPRLRDIANGRRTQGANLKGVRKAPAKKAHP